MDRRIAELRELQLDLENKAERVRQITAELTAERIDAASTRGNVRATVTGQGGLTGLRIATDAVGPKAAHPELLAAEIVEAVNAARSAAADENRRRLHEVVPTMYPSDEEVARDHA